MKDFKPGDPMKIRFQPGETGWATFLGGDLARIDNIPFDGELNLHDIVRFKIADDFPAVSEVITHRYEKKETVSYMREWQFHRLIAIFQILGCSTEGGIGPDEKNGRPGLMMVAAPEEVFPQKIVDALGFSPKSNKQS